MLGLIHFNSFTTERDFYLMPRGYKTSNRGGPIDFMQYFEFKVSLKVLKIVYIINNNF